MSSIHWWGRLKTHFPPLQDDSLPHQLKTLFLMRFPAHPMETFYAEDAFALVLGLSSNFNFAVPGEFIAPPPAPIVIQLPLALTLLH